MTLSVATMDEVETGPMLSLKKRALVESFVKGMDGKRVLQRVLIANNGMAATKAILSMRQWAYMTLGDERAIEFVAMATRDDLNANAEFIRLADAYVEVPSGSNKVCCIYVGVDSCLYVGGFDCCLRVWSLHHLQTVIRCYFNEFV